jgi:hypothetical protein
MKASRMRLAFLRGARGIAPSPFRTDEAIAEEYGI